ncbi:MAG: HPr family phosphocarrier protein [Eubacterium sp.]
MITKDITIQIQTGLEARPVALFVQVASQFDSSIHVQYDNKKVNAKSIMGMMTLGLTAGETVNVIAEGEDEEAAISSIEEYLSSK